MRRMTPTMLPAALSVWIASACYEPTARLNAPPQGDSVRQAAGHEAFAYMSDQGLLADRSIADIHFVPHTAEVSGTGRARLQRYAELLATRGGTITYDTQIADATLVAARLKSAELVLAETVPDGDRIRVVVGLPGSDGMTGEEAVVRRRQMLQRAPSGQTETKEQTPSAPTPGSEPPGS